MREGNGHAVDVEKGRKSQRVVKGSEASGHGGGESAGEIEGSGIGTEAEEKRGDLDLMTVRQTANAATEARRRKLLAMESSADSRRTGTDERPSDAKAVGRHKAETAVPTGSDNVLGGGVTNPHGDDIEEVKGCKLSKGFAVRDGPGGVAIGLAESRQEGTLKKG